jgi:hypothetical protein
LLFVILKPAKRLKDLKSRGFGWNRADEILQPRFAGLRMTN